MKTVMMAAHNFVKQNLVSLKGGADLYKCSACGATGKRHGFVDHINMTDKEFAKTLNCNYKTSAVIAKRPIKVVLSNMPYIGIESGTHDVVDCPIQYQEFINDIWVYSKSRKEPVRILPPEIDKYLYD